MSEEARWEGIHPDSLFSRSIEQVMRDWGLVRSGESNREAERDTPKIMLTDGYLVAESRCEGCRALIDEYGRDTPLPPADCYGGTGLGVWLDSYLDRNYFPGVRREDPNLRILQEGHWRLWRDLGVSNVVSSNPDSYATLHGPAFDFSITMVGGNVRPFLTRLPDGTVQVNTTYYFMQDFDAAWRNAVRDGLVDSAILDEILELIRSILPDLNAQRNHANPNQQETVEETERFVMTELYGYLMDISRSIDALSRTTTSRGTASLSLYDIATLDLLFEYLWPLLEQGRLRLMPDLYNEATSLDRLRLWTGIADRIREQAVTRTRVQPMLRTVRPFIEMKCHTCDPRKTPQSACSPSWLVCDMMMAALLGFGGPYLYISYGVDQRFYEAAIIGAWLMGCAPALNRPERPRTLGELSDLLCLLFPRVDDARSRRRRDEYLRQFPAYLAHPRMYDNPMTCVPCCTRTTASGEIELCNTFDGPMCKEDLPCCQPIQNCNLRGNYPCRPGPHP